MRRNGVYICILMLGLSLFSASTLLGADFSGGFLLGYAGGPGAQLSFSAANFAQSFPLSARLGIGYTSVDPGSPLAARQIFINDATNGTPQEKGYYWDFRFDLAYAFSSSLSRHFAIYAGPRYARFTANFNFIGGNEDFDITSQQWGLGLGLDGVFAMGARTDLVLTGGVDYYGNGTLQGHDTAYDPSGEDVNGRNDYTFADADNAVNQPKFEPRLMIGIQRRFGR